MQNDQTKNLIQGLVVGIFGLISGTSVGTIAFIFGLYPQIFFQFAWRIIFGILLGLILMRSLYPLILPNYFHETYALLFGLVASFVVIEVYQNIKNLKSKRASYFIGGIVISTILVLVSKKIQANSFFEGVLQSLQFLLPGGNYDAYHARHFGALKGSSVFFKVLGVTLTSFLITRGLMAFCEREKIGFHLTMFGMIVAALPQIWPWREAAEMANWDGRIQVVSEKFFFPSFSLPQTWWCLGLMSVSAIVIFLMRKKIS